MNEKRCPSCGVIKPLEEFSFDASNKRTGKRSTCKPCDIKKVNERRKRPENREAYRESALARNRKIGRSTPRSGHVYVIRCERFYKIGKSNHAERRLKQINRFVPFDIKLIHKIASDDISLAELHFHDKFKDKRHTGEWFELCAADVEYIKGVSELIFGK